MSSKKVMMFGTFDILHAGHLHIFKEAKKKGDELIAIVARDKNVIKIKRHKPFHNEAERKKILEHIDYIDKVFLGDIEDIYKTIRQIKPDVILLGYDQKTFVDGLRGELKRVSPKTKVLRLKPYKSGSYKTKKIKEYLNKYV